MKEKQVFTNITIDELRRLISDVVSKELRKYKPTANEDVEFIKVDEACALLSISKPTIYKYMREGRVKGVYYLGTRLLFKKDELLNSI